MNNVIKEEQYPIVSNMVCLRDIYCGKIINDRITISPNYVIPYYQRPYEWQWNDKQLKGLFDTVVRNAIDELDCLPEHENSDNYKIRFAEKDYLVFGTIQLNRTQHGKYEIIDGQQRIVSFWLLINAIDSIRGKKDECLKCEIDNQIAEHYNEQFKNYESDNNRYATNYFKLKNELQSLISEKEKEKIIFDLIDLKNYILNKTLFAIMITDYSDNVQKTISLFNSLNTTGLDLGMKDIFKIRFFEYLRKNNRETTVDEIFQEINKAYASISSIEGIYSVSVEDFIDTFKLWIILNDDNSSYLSKKIKSSSHGFFNESQYGVFEKYSADKSLKTFVDIADSIVETQIIMKQLDDSQSRERDVIQLCSYELLRNCGYWYLRNLFFVFTYAIRKKKNNDKLDDGDIKRALNICKYIWKICSVAKINDLRVRDRFFDYTTSIAKKIINNTEIDNLEKSDSYYVNNPEESAEYVNAFREAITKKIYGNRQCWFFVALSYLDDVQSIAYQDNKSVKLSEVKKRIFYPDKKEKYEIEHILSQGLASYETEEIKDRLGNLIFLSSSINKSLGGRTRNILNNETDDKTINDKTTNDFNGKIDNSENHINNYRTDSENNDNLAIRWLLTSLDNQSKDYCISFDNILKFQKERCAAKQKRIIELYKDVIEIDIDETYMN